MDITFEFATRDDCLDKMVPSDLRQLVAERDNLKTRLREAEYEGAESFKAELLKASKAIAHPYIEGVFAVWEDRREGFDSAHYDVPGEVVPVTTVLERLPMLESDHLVDAGHRPPTPVGWSDTDWLAHVRSLGSSEEEWRPIHTAPRDGTAIQARIPPHGSDNIIAWRDGLIDGADNECGGWVFVDDTQHPPPCWDDGVCWGRNSQGDPSTPPSAWKPIVGGKP
jgi:hypothetical protein